MRYPRRGQTEQKGANRQVPRGGMNTTDPNLIEVIDSRGRTLTPCRRKVADREVRLGRAKWIGRRRIRLRFDPFAYRHIRLKVLARDRYTCYWCGRPGFTMDHVIPWSKGGRTTMANCICACEECNGRRGDMDAAEFAHLMGRPTPHPQLILSGRHLAAEAAAAPEPVTGTVRPHRFARLARLLEAEPVRRRSLY
ncbi:conserved domain protein [Symbiobacterium thermophilum IAM 14863]|uniref:Conserved domain protein n=2 Tax=Symbiobacterium thermophilum TaxID=2734 RepID=Q67T42_SYMTH|nr:conserved domain protein [Symbiobacterium thermophilum IAM 14863]